MTTSGWGAGRPWRVVDDVVRLVPLSFGLPVIGSILLALVALFGTSWPDIVDSTAIDAAALHLGQGIYQDPSDGYTGTGYTPLAPVAGALLNDAWYWRGWIPVLTLLANLLLIASVAAAAYAPHSGVRRERVVAALEAAGIGALAWWTLRPLDGFAEDRPDELSWALALAGLLAVQRLSSGARWRILAVVLLTAAFWTKQTALVAAAAAVLWTAGGAYLRWWPRRTFVRFTLELLATNLLILGLANVVTRGWEFVFNFAIPAEQPCCEASDSLPLYLKFWVAEFLVSSFWTLLFAVASCALAVAAVAMERGRRPEGGIVDRLRSLGPQGRLLALFTVFVVLAVPAAIRARWNIGSAVNQNLGLVWAIALIGAVAYGIARRRRLTGMLAGLLVLVLLASSQVVPERMVLGHEFAARAIRMSPDWPVVPPALVAYAESHAVYHPDYGDLSVERMGAAFPGWIGLTPLLGSGRRPEYLERAILGRRFEAVFPFAAARVSHPLSSGDRRFEENYLWKLNEAMRLRYRPSATAPEGALVRTSGPVPAPWLERCWGPYEVAGTVLRQRQGGGFWCPAGATISLRATPAAASELRSEESFEEFGGTLRVVAESAAASVAVRLGRDGRTVWELRMQAAGDELQFDVVTASGQSSATLPRNGQGTGVTIEIARGSGDPQRLGAGRIRVSIPAGLGGRLSLVASRGSGTSFDLERLKLGP